MRKQDILRRSMSIDSGAIDEEKRTVSLTFSSEEPYRRITYEHGEIMEVLSHAPDDVDMSRLVDGAAVLVNHNPDDQVGVVEHAEIGEDRRGKAMVRFGKSARAEEIFRDVMDGIRRNISVGYKWLKEVKEMAEGEAIPTLRVSWLPMEISFASVPADATVGVGRMVEDEEEEEDRECLEEGKKAGQVVIITY